ncbi:MAG: hypothetical protein ACRCYD_00100, partial [Plesiomonas sp.]
MALFNLQVFLGDPTWELNGYKKTELMAIADHYQISLGKQMRKQEIKETVAQRLIELGILSVGAVEAATEEVLDSVDVGAGQFSAEEEANEMGGTAVGEAVAEAETKPGLSPFDPFSPVSLGSGVDARLKVR